MRFFKAIFCEPAETKEPGRHDGKPSFGRFWGAVVIVFILVMAGQGKKIPDEVMTMFWVLVGYSMISKALNGVSPVLLEYVRGLTIKANKLPSPSN